CATVSCFCSHVLYYCLSAASLCVLASFPTRRSSDLHDQAGHVTDPCMEALAVLGGRAPRRSQGGPQHHGDLELAARHVVSLGGLDRKSTRLNSSHVKISYAGFCLQKKTKILLIITDH